MISRIRKIPLFARLPEDKLHSMMWNNQLYCKKYSKGATLYNQGDPCKTMDIVLEGGFLAYSLSEKGSEMTVFEFSEGENIGANLLFGNDHAYPLTIYCSADAQVLHLTKEAVSYFLRDHGFALQLVGILSYRSQELNRKVIMATQKTLRENLLEYFRQQALLQNTDTILLPISKKQLADYLGVQRPSLFRELKKLKEEGIIEVLNRRIHVKHLRGESFRQ